MRLDGRAIYISGGGHGIGRASALRLAGEGGRIAVADIDRAAAEGVAAEIVAGGGTGFATICDLTSATS
ncbi:MAG TPA: SDR family NAD(P)-dependent oxidoreductase, partial [Devosia sp.]|nr:SDR family NAD(P)-dependent oxidoreductase [Devosia sp.]